MAYARRKSTSYRARKPIRRSVRRSRSTVKTRRYKRIYRRPMTKRRILNATSRKKRDTMLAASNTNSAGSPLPNTGTRAIVYGGTSPPTGSSYNGGFFLWCATARDLTINSGPAGAVAQEATRTATTCYMRGLSEKLRVQTNSPAPWFWRRICFTIQAAFGVAAPGDSPTNTYSDYLENSNGFTRLWLNQNINSQGNTTAGITNIVFKGAVGRDWRDLISAPVDTRRVNLKYDKTRVFRSGNQSGIVRELKLWHPMNRNLVYDDDEVADVENTSVYSVVDKRGMGNYYVLDIIQPGEASSASDLLLIDSTSSLYWHEK
ncbi:capsid protein [Poaceae associated gemycircularvirus 1]|uniref:Capsid protein n=1 Tax=Poaceae associated gemycircularvirus 1 TaxID=1985392 RepID=A0A0M4G0X9_9VIRU|nr:capsid protein [Poaceae associated gemycircularvirus 1]ALC76162.1 capsid protein [Poaceae associated gemycircularvirus 1]ALC76165.1 capsid protein [Poaceae associated gemycircularvirus 1]ALC76168.1 capsid protein [Poaceae associated gemycircularvirus 1]